MDNNFSGYNELLDLQLICVIYSPTGGKISTGAGVRTGAGGGDLTGAGGGDLAGAGV